MYNGSQLYRGNDQYVKHDRYLITRFHNITCFEAHCFHSVHLKHVHSAGPPIEHSRKRRKGEGGDDSDEESQSGLTPPMNDIYRARQQKRVNTTHLS